MKFPRFRLSTAFERRNYGFTKKGYKKLDVWHKSDALAYHIYLITKKFPHDEMFGLTSQLRRASVSIPTNIAEGNGRQNRNETKQFINVALGSLAETEYLLGFCARLGFISEVEYERLEGLREQIGAMLWKLYQSFNS